MENFFIKNLADIQIRELISTNSVIIGLDVGDKTVGVSASDRRIRVASGLSTISRKGNNLDFQLLTKCLQSYKVGLIIFGWPVQMNGIPGKQCEKVLEFVQKLFTYFPCDYAKWDERFSTSVVDRILINANLSREKRKKYIDQSAAIYILQGAIDFLNKNLLFPN
ncbi:MAG: Holliday junction resolvase RuvX [Holosporaceae bacterium]|jgi:putative Holliday junction resolvase|nr:Holliday junction resolvase RuvX [Holosporaceae bacterium]